MLDVGNKNRSILELQESIDIQLMGVFDKNNQ